MKKIILIFIFLLSLSRSKAQNYDGYRVADAWKQLFMASKANTFDVFKNKGFKQYHSPLYTPTAGEYDFENGDYKIQIYYRKSGTAYCFIWNESLAYIRNITEDFIGEGFIVQENTVDSGGNPIQHFINNKLHLGATVNLQSDDPRSIVISYLKAITPSSRIDDRRDMGRMHL
jgi:hypothetical protein